MEIYLGIDIGGTSTRAKAIDSNQKVVGEFSFDTDKDYQALLGKLEQAIKESQLSITSVGVGVATSVRDGVLGGGGKLSGWTGKSLQQDLQRLLELPVSIINDAKSATLGEATRRNEDFIFVIWGTGVGCSVCSYVTGRQKVQATELGHMVIDFNSDKICGCGNKGHLEAHVGGGYIHDRFGVEANQLLDDQWSMLLKELSIGIYNIALGQPGLPIVFGGGVSLKQLNKAGRLAELQSLVDEITKSNLIPTPQLSIAHYGEDSGMIGAAYAAQRLYQKTEVIAL